MPSQPVWLYQGNRVWCTRVSSARQRKKKKKKKGKGRGGGWFKRVMENDKRLLVNELRCPRPLLPLSPLPLFLRCPSSSLKLSEHASAVSLLESGELHYIKEINNYFPTVFYFSLMKITSFWGCVSSNSTLIPAEAAVHYLTLNIRKLPVACTKTKHRCQYCGR